MKTKNMAIFAVLSLVLFSSAVFAAPLGLPNQFFGSVTINGAPAPDGTTVTAKISGATVSTVATVGGKYGYSQNIFYVEDPDNNRYGNLIQFFVNGVDSGATASFKNGESTGLNLAVTIATQQTTTTTSSGGGGGGGGGSTPTVTQTQTTTTTSTQPKTTSTSGGPCVEKWTCGEWSKCDGSLQKRTCKDANKCGTIEELPMTTQPCSLYEETQKSASTSGAGSSITGRILSFATGSGAPVVGGIVLGGLVGYYFLNKKKSGAKKKKGNYTFNQKR